MSRGSGRGAGPRSTKNHPRWDPHIELNADGSLGLRSVARRRNSRFCETSDGTVTVTNGSAQRARLRHPRRSQPRHRLTNFEPVGEGRTRVTIWVDMHDLGDSMAGAVCPDRSPWRTRAVCWTRTTRR